MSSAKAQQVITQESLSSLHQSQERKPVAWKDFGIYLDQKLESRLDNENSSDSTFPNSFSKFAPDNSLLSLVIKYKICKSCERPISERNLGTHFPRCSQMKGKRQEDSGSNNALNGTAVKRKRGRAANVINEGQSSVDSSRNGTPVSGTPASSNGVTRPRKKYKKSQTQKEKEAANAAASNPSSAGTGGKKKKQTKQKPQIKTKGPVDVEKQCGVPLPSGGFCARSLTCKTHSMGAKRAVPGRSAPYDVLLQQYQKRNQAKLAANSALAAQRRENAEFNESMENGADGMYKNGAYNRILDPDEETHMVLEGVAKSYPIPLERKVIMPTRNRHRLLYMREAYANALISLGNNSNSSQSSPANEQTLANQAISGSIGGIQGRCALVNVDAPNRTSGDSVTQTGASICGELYQVRAPSKAILLTAQYNLMQQQLFQQQLMKFQQQQQMLLMKQRQAQQQNAAQVSEK